VETDARTIAVLNVNTRWRRRIALAFQFDIVGSVKITEK
jgi:hypothetical protein